MLKHKIYQAMLVPDQSSLSMKLQDKKMPLISIDDHKNIVKFIKVGQGDQPSAAITNTPLSLNSCLVYFQAHILNCKNNSDIAIGLTNKDAALKKHPGQSKFSVGYKSSGEVYFHRSKVGTLPSYSKKNIIGVGVDYIKKQIFFTRNGCIQTLTIQGYDDIGWSKFYPCVSLHSEGDQVQLFFDKFQFKLNQYREESELTVYNSIEQQECNYGQIYQLVADYLAFNGYMQTYNMLKQDQGQFFKQGKFVKNPFIQNKLTNNKSGPEDLIRVQEADGEANGNSDDQIEVPQQFKRQRIMSDYWGYMNQDQPVRKYTAGEERAMQSLRKSSIISNDGSMVNIIEQSEQENQQLQNEFLSKYLKTTRIKIIQLIRQQKLQEAQSILRNTLPQIFNFDTKLQIYFKIHIYLRKIKRQSALAAIQYIRQLKDIVLKFTKDQFFKYSKKDAKIIKTSFQDIIGSLRYENDLNYDTLCYEQFEGFSQYVNSVILTGLGFQCQSRLDMIINHLNKIQQKTIKYQIPGPVFNFDTIEQS